jgi:predicted N-acyltransferase
MPTPTYSLHLIADPRFRDAVERYLTEERSAVAREIDYLSERGPFRKGD